ncbi:MAG: alpha/beta hydrolase [Bacteroidales bacterium]|nr:alpha/beta hydrolase [Bacteroidales bacterium]
MIHLPRYLLPLLLLGVLLGSCKPEQGQIIPLWEGKAPGSEQVSMTEIRNNVNLNIFNPNRAIRQIQDPTIEIFRPEKPNGTSVLICPGGGYWMIIYDKEGIDIAKWFNSIGVTAFVLKYRLPAEGHANGKDIPLQDAQRAVRIIRANAANWQLDPNRIGILGTSAGGHLAALLGTSYSRETYPRRDSIDLISPRPDFMILLYAVISMDPAFTHQGSLHALLGEDPPEELIRKYSAETLVDENTPPAFIVASENDHTVSPENSRLFHQVLEEKGIPVEMHIFPRGGHGFSVKKSNYAGSRWPGMCESWLRKEDFLD